MTVYRLPGAATSSMVALVRGCPPVPFGCANRGMGCLTGSPFPCVDLFRALTFSGCARWMDDLRPSEAQGYAHRGGPGSRPSGRPRVTLIGEAQGCAHRGGPGLRPSGRPRVAPIGACERPIHALTAFGRRFLASPGPSPEVVPAFVAGLLTHVAAPTLVRSPRTPSLVRSWPGTKPRKCPLYFL